ncbi:MAG TPA: hypothetical protein VKV39_05910 [Candidatus Sulfotelmatobacter sp.]|nr:hypothetical protein [Candidatus Sulfotelmatobacter sp.]
MRLCMKLWIASLILPTCFACAQEIYHPPDPALMARLSYDNSGVVVHDQMQRICIAVSRDGEYHIMRSLDDGRLQRLQGKLPKEEFDKLSQLIEAPDFRSLSGYHGGLVRQEAETFAAEIPSASHSSDAAQSSPEKDVWQLRWMNGDRENPFPPAVSKIVGWLRNFQPKDTKSFDYSEYPDVCPAGGFRFVQPSVAENSQP